MDKQKTFDESAIIDVALAADRNYIVGLIVTACSIAKHVRRGTFLNFHILQSDFSDVEKTLVCKSIEKYIESFDVVFYDVDIGILGQLPKYSSQMTYARLMLPNLLVSAQYVIYVDVDVLWQADIAELWENRRDVKQVACVREMSAKTINQECCWFKNNGFEFVAEKYICAGISFYNLNAIRKDQVFEKVIDFGRRYRGFTCADQSMLYGVFLEGKIDLALLPDKWQCFPRNGVNAEKGRGLVLHYAGEAPWKVTHITKMITDTQLLWFDMCAEVFGETRWQSLRRWYTPTKIVFARLLFLIIFRISPIHAIFRWYTTKQNYGSFEESLKS